MPELDSALVASPCTGVCRINLATGWCEGCFRTIDEIGGWSTLDAQGRLAVWDVLVERRGEVWAGHAGTPASLRPGEKLAPG